MASLDSKQVSDLRSRIEACSEPYLLAYLEPQSSPAKTMEGTLGVIDWCLHGTISKLLKQEDLGDFTLVPQNRLLGKASLLLLSGDAPKNLPKILKQLNIQRLCIAAGTIPEGALPKLQQQLVKAGVGYSTLESDQ